MGFGGGRSTQKKNAFKGGLPRKIEGKGGGGVGQNSEIKKWNMEFSQILDEKFYCFIHEI